MITTRRLFLGMVACLPLAWQVKLGTSLPDGRPATWHEAFRRLMRLDARMSAEAIEQWLVVNCSHLPGYAAASGECVCRDGQWLDLVIGVNSPDARWAIREVPS